MAQHATGVSCILLCSPMQSQLLFRCQCRTRLPCICQGCGAHKLHVNSIYLASAARLVVKFSTRSCDLHQGRVRDRARVGPSDYTAWRPMYWRRCVCAVLDAWETVHRPPFVPILRVFTCGLSGVHTRLTPLMTAKHSNAMVTVQKITTSFV